MKKNKLLLFALSLLLCLGLVAFGQTRLRRRTAAVYIDDSSNVVIAPGPTSQTTLTGALSQNGVVRNSTTVSLSAAQIIAMRTTPVTLVAAPGAGKCVVVDNVTLKMTTTATGFANGGAVEIRYTDGSGTKVTADIAAAVITAGAGSSFTNVRGIEASLTGTANAPVVMTNATAAFATGTGTAVVTIDYHIVG